MLTLEYVIQLLDIVRVKGKHEPVKIYEVEASGPVSASKADELALYDKAHELYMQAKFDDAKKIFDELYKLYSKYLYNMYSLRCEELRNKNIQEFDGVFEFTSK